MRLTAIRCVVLYLFRYHGVRSIYCVLFPLPLVLSLLCCLDLGMSEMNEIFAIKIEPHPTVALSLLYCCFPIQSKSMWLLSLVTDDVVPIVLPHKNHQGDNIPVKCLSVSPAGNLIAAGCDDGAVRVWAYGDADDDAAWGGGKHNTRGTGKDKIGSGQVYRREPPQPQPQPRLAPHVASGAASLQAQEGSAVESLEGFSRFPQPNGINNLDVLADAVLGGGALAEQRNGASSETESGVSGFLSRTASRSVSSNLMAWEGGGGMEMVGESLGGIGLRDSGVGQQALAGGGEERDSGGSRTEEMGRERRSRGRGREGGVSADGAGAKSGENKKGELEVRLATMLFGKLFRRGMYSLLLMGECSCGFNYSWPLTVLPLMKSWVDKIYFY